MRKTVTEFLAEEHGLELVEYAFLAVFLGLVAIIFLPNSEEAINHTFHQYSRVLFPN